MLIGGEAVTEKQKILPSCQPARQDHRQRPACGERGTAGQPFPRGSRERQLAGVVQLSHGAAQLGIGQQTVTGTWVHTHRGTQRVTM